MALQFSQGTPADTLGVDGDYDLDTTNRFFYGPKAGGTWTGTPIYSLTGATGPALLSGIGNPAAGFGAIGQGYLDLATGNTWGPKTTATGWGTTFVGNILGPQGVAGPSGQSVPSLLSQSFVLAPPVNNATAIALSGTPTIIPAPGGTQPGYFVPTLATNLVAATLVLSSANSPGATTFTLQDITANTTIYTYTISTAGTVTNQSGFSFALTPGNTHVWRVTGSGSAFVQVMPTYSQPSSQPLGVSYAPVFANSQSLSPTSVTAFAVAGSSTVTQYLGVPKTGLLYSASLTNTATSAATIALYNSSSTVVWSQSVPANQTLPLNVGPFGPSTAVLLAGSYTWRVTCASPGFFSVASQILL